MFGTSSSGHRTTPTIDHCAVLHIGLIDEPYSAPTFTPSNWSMNMHFKSLRWIVPIHVLAGAIVSIFVLHPITMVVYYLEFHQDLSRSEALEMASARAVHAFSPKMWPMTGTFFVIGSVLGIGSGLYSAAIARKMLLVSQLDRRLATSIEPLIQSGETEFAEFKSSLRWDHQLNKINKALEVSIVKTMAGFLNHNGGDLLIGVADDGAIIGLENDYATLRKKSRDGFELLLMQLAKQRLGGDVCTLLHTVFQEINGHDVCRVLIDRASRPVYVQYDDQARYYLRIGNSTRELDTREALEHISNRGS